MPVGNSIMQNYWYKEDSCSREIEWKRLNIDVIDVWESKKDNSLNFKNLSIETPCHTCDC